MLNLNSPLPDRIQVVIKDIDIPFWSLVRILVNLSVAAIPAMIILWIIGMILTVLLMIITGVGAGVLEKINQRI